MSNELPNELFSYLSKTSIKLSAGFPFKDHIQFPVLVDVMIRKNRPHLRLQSKLPIPFHRFFMAAFVQYLQQENSPLSLRHADCIHINLSAVREKKQSLRLLAESLQHLYNELEKKEKRIIIAFSALNDVDEEEKKNLLNQLEAFYAHPRCRFILWNEISFFSAYQQDFTPLNLLPLTTEDTNALLKQHRTELENFHHVIIPDELLTQGYTLTERYISVDHTLENAFLLLDSSAARTASLERLDNPAIKPILTQNTLLQVLSGWTQIPLSQLLLNKFKLSEFIQQMQENILGQEHAIHILGQTIEAAFTKSMTRSPNVFASFLFAGAKHSGKRTCYLSLVDQLFKKTHLLYIAAPGSSQLTSLAQLRVKRHADQTFFMLKEVIKNCPYAIIVIEDIEKAPATVMHGLEEIFHTGYLAAMDENYSFRHAMLILTTTCGAKSIKQLNQTLSLQKEKENIDLMQLIMSDKKQAGMRVHTLSPGEVVEAVLPEIKLHFPAFIYQNVTLIPFFPLSKSTIEKMMHLKLISIKKSLHTHQGIHLAYAPEVVHYLSSYALKPATTENEEVSKDEVNIALALSKLTHLIEQAIQHKMINKLRMQHLFLQLNGNGTLLRWEWSTGMTEQQVTI